ncbi:MAG TPA: ABC transporter permease [Thermoguttaceae bacterium]|nr:ABC transporter permease [Thermoguttaceae bacterium]
MKTTWPRLLKLPGRFEARDIAPLVTLALLIVFFSFAGTNFLGPATLTLVLQQGAVLGIVSVGLTYVLLCAEIDLSVGMMALWGAASCGWLFENWALGTGGEGTASAGMIALVILVPLLSCLALGLLTGVLTVWSRLPSFIISLAMMFIAEGLAKYLTQSQMQSLPSLVKSIGNDGIKSENVLHWMYSVSGVDLPGLFHSMGIDMSRFWEGYKLPFSAMLAVVIFLVAHLVLQHTRFGRYVYMTGGNRQSARLAGVRTGWIVIACLAICAVTAGLGGIINAGRMTHITLDQNKDLLLSAVACVVLGGTSLFGGEGGIGKTVIGVLTFTVLNVGLIRINWIDDLARQLLLGTVLMAALVINGLLAKER